MSKSASRQAELNVQRAGRFLAEHADEIVTCWVEKVGVDPHTSSDHRHHLRDHLPQLLQQIGKDLVQDRREHGETTEVIAEKHGRQRWQLGWSVAGVVSDYQSLRPVVEEQLKKELGDPLPPEVVSRLASLIDQAVAESLESYAEFQSEQQDQTHRSASEFAAIVASSADAIISISSDGEILSWNPAAEEMYGYSAEEAVGQNVSLIFPAERRLEVDRLLEAAKRNEPIHGMDTVRQTKDGAKTAIAASVSPICDRTGAVVGCALIERDISEKQRTAQALRRALEEAESAVIARANFLANVSHELRTPMNAVIGMTTLTLDEELSETARDNLVTARDAADVMLNLVNSLLDVSKFESGEFDLDENPFSLRRMLDDTMRLGSVRAVQKGLNISCRVDRNVPDRLCGDALRLQQILTNLIGNAVKFTDQGEVSVDASMRDCDHETCDLEFAVRDTGVGISEKDQQRIFTPFTQVDASSTRRYSGSGLGLSIVAHLAKQLGGKVSLESEVGVGSVFRFRVPIRRAAAALDDLDFVATAQQLRGIPILVVENDPTHRNMVAEMARGWGMQPIETGDAEAALLELRRASSRDQPIQVVLAEALLPKQDGFELVERIASDEELSPITLLLISASDRLALRERCQISQVDGFIDKPICESAVFDCIVEALSRRILTNGSASGPADWGRIATPAKVLVVEDTKANRKVVTRSLAKRGHDCVVAVDGKEAVDRFQQESFDVILMDVQMPVMDGLQAAKEIRKLESERADCQPTPIIAMTAHAMHGDRERCLASGMDDYLTKPIDVRRLAKTVESAAKRGGGAPALNRSADPSHGGTEPPSAPVESINMEAALKRLRGDRKLLLELIECFFEDYQELLQQVEESLNEKDFETLARSAHNLKGLSSNFDAEKTPELAAQLQRAADRNDSESAREILPRLKRSAGDLAHQLESMR